MDDEYRIAHMLGDIYECNTMLNSNFNLKTCHAMGRSRVLKVS